MKLDLKTDKKSTTKKKPFRFHGTVMTIDRPTMQNFLFSREVIEKLLIDLKDRVDQRKLLGELYFDKYPPQSAEVSLLAVSHVVTKLYLDFNGDLKIEAEALDTELGRLVKTMVRGGEISFRIRGYGTLKHRKDGLIEVTDDFVITAIDLEGLVTW